MCQSWNSFFKDFLESDVVEDQLQLKMAAALAVTRLVHRACTNTSTNVWPQLVMDDVCTVDDDLIGQRLVPWLNHQLRKATEDVERVAMLAALGNIGHEVILPVVLPFISSCQPGGSQQKMDWYQRHVRVTLLNAFFFQLMRKVLFFDQVENVPDEEGELVEKRSRWQEHKKRQKQKTTSLREMIEERKRHHKQKREEPHQEEDVYDEDVGNPIEDQAVCNLIRTKVSNS